jgi:hypothetical protein
MREKSTGCAAATAIFDSTEVAEIGKLAGVEDGITVGTEAGIQLDGDGAVGGDGRLRASATLLAVPEVWPMSEVNSAIKERWRCCRADQGGKTRSMAATRGCEETKMATFKKKPEVTNGGMGG